MNYEKVPSPWEMGFRGEAFAILIPNGKKHKAEVYPLKKGYKMYGVLGFSNFNFNDLCIVIIN